MPEKETTPTDAELVEKLKHQDTQDKPDAPKDDKDDSGVDTEKGKD